MRRIDRRDGDTGTPSTAVASRLLPADVHGGLERNHTEEELQAALGAERHRLVAGDQGATGADIEEPYTHPAAEAKLTMSVDRDSR
jgi:hypothetical protein